MAKGKFVTAINCMDGRVQLPVIEYLKSKFEADYVDMITEPGPDGLLANSSANRSVVEQIKKRVEISVKKHGSKVVAITAHHDCAGNPVEKEQHIEHLRSAVEAIKSWGFDVEIIALWIDDNWQVHRVVL